MPFKGSWDTPSRTDCSTRWYAIKDHLGDIQGKTLVDIGCANGYFGFKFLQAGGEFVNGVEIDTEIVDFVNKLAKDNNMNFECTTQPTDNNFDFCLYLDLHYHDGLNFLRYIKNHSKVAFISPSGDGNKNSPRLEEALKELYLFVEPIYTGFENRTIFKCE